MERPEALRRIFEAERDILRAMCQSTPERTVRADGLKTLADYRFADIAHQLVFDTLREIPSNAPSVIREQLPARLNNKGFPDLDWETFFAPHHLTAEEVVAYMQALRDGLFGGAPPSAAAR